MQTKAKITSDSLTTPELLAVLAKAMSGQSLADHIASLTQNPGALSGPSAVPERSLPEVYYESATQKYHRPSKDGYICVGRGEVANFLMTQGYSARYGDEPLSEVDKVLVQIQTEQSVRYVGSLAGHKAGYYPGFKALVTSSPRFFTPVPGNWPLLEKLTSNLFGEEQLPYVYGWLKVSLEMYRTGKHQPGQAFVMCGPPGAGKNLFREVISEILGGRDRVAHPHQFMTSETTFNSDMFSGETLAIEDESSKWSIQARSHFGAMIKGVVANKDARCHRKNCEALPLRPLWRLIISLNDEPERLMVLPPLASDIEDKLMLFKVEKHALPMPTGTGEEQDIFWNALVKEMPAFVHFLNEWQIPDELKSPRFGILHYHHPDVVDALGETTPEHQLEEVINEVIFAPGNPRVWVGKPSQLETELKDKNSPRYRDADRILVHPNSCGIYLGRLKKKYPERFSSRKSGTTIWRIVSPEGLVAPCNEAKQRLAERLAEARMKPRDAASPN